MKRASAPPWPSTDDDAWGAGMGQAGRAARRDGEPAGASTVGLQTVEQPRRTCPLAPCASTADGPCPTAGRAHHDWSRPPAILVSVADAPTADVVRAFGGDPSALVLLDGGGGTSWRAGNIVLKPAGQAEEVGWIAAFVEALDVDDHLRVAKQLRTPDGEHVRAGWAATEWLEGQHHGDRWDEALLVSRVFHAAARMAPTDWPTFMRNRSDQWSRATKIAWAEEPRPPLSPAGADLVDAMADLVRDPPGSAQFQVVHSDLAGNLLFADELDLPPAVIDVSPQFRSVPYAEAILVADAAAWNGAPLCFVEQFLEGSTTRRADTARAIIFRVVTAALFPDSTPARVDAEAEGYKRLLPAVLP